MLLQDNIFANEFRDMMNARRAQNSSFSITDIPLPDLGLYTDEDFVGKGAICAVKNLTEEYFSKLNGSEVQLVGSRTLERRQVIRGMDGKGEFRKDAQGNYVTVTEEVKKGFVAVYSTVNINLPRMVEKNGNRKEYKSTDGFKYIDMLNTATGRKYIYTLPAAALYPVELCALVVCFNKHRAYYKGCKIALTNGYYVYLYSIPFKYKENSGYSLIGAKAGSDFSKEVKDVIALWKQENVIFDFRLTSLENQVRGESNLGLVDIPGTLYESEYKKYDKSLADKPQGEVEVDA